MFCPLKLEFLLEVLFYLPFSPLMKEVLVVQISELCTMSAYTVGKR